MSHSRKEKYLEDCREGFCILQETDRESVNFGGLQAGDDNFVEFVLWFSILNGGFGGSHQQVMKEIGE